MIIILIRTFFLYLTVLFVLRVMGKGELSKMDPFQMVVLFMMAELAALPIESPDVGILDGVTALAGLLFLEVLISYVSLKSEKFKRLVSGKPSVLIEKGKIDAKELEKLRISINDLSEQLRLKNVPSISDVDYAILEANGDLSVIPKPDKKPLTPKDLSISMKSETLPIVLIADGYLYQDSLTKIQLSENQLNSQLLAFGVTDYSQVFICFSDENKKIHVYPKPPESLGISDINGKGSSHLTEAGQPGDTYGIPNLFGDKSRVDSSNGGQKPEGSSVNSGLNPEDDAAKGGTLE